MNGRPLPKPSKMPQVKKRYQSTLSSSKSHQRANRGQKRGIVLPAWLRAIPESQGHGSGTYQKRLWRLVSDYVRIRDFNNYGYTVDGKKMHNWRDAQGGHFLEYSICRGMFKFFLGNIFAESAQSNSFKNTLVRDKIEEELRRRYGQDIKQHLKKMNQISSLDFSNTEVIQQMKFILSLMQDYPEKPDYYERVVNLLKNE